MSACLLSLAFFLQFIASTHCRLVQYHITPSPDILCLQNPCLTLSQFAANTSSYTGQETNVSLIFFSGNHILDSALSLSFVNNISMTSQGKEPTLIQCISEHEKLVIDDTAFASIKVFILLAVEVTKSPISKSLLLKTPSS